MTKKKIVILGGGMASLSAAYELTNYDGWQNDYEITLYQMGWRVGGKTSTGRGVHDRIEEVGIHIFQGWYENAFKIFQEAYAYCEHNNLFPPDFPFKTWKDAFVQEDATLLTQWFEPKGKWISRNWVFPANNLVPGQGGSQPISVAIEKMLYMLHELIFGLPNQQTENKGIWGVIKKLLGLNNKESELAKASKDYIAKATQTAKRSSLLRELFADVASLAPHLFLKNAADKIKDLKGNPVIYEEIIELLEEFTKWFVGFTNLFPKDSERIYWIRVIGEFGLVAIRGFLEDIYDPKTNQLNFNNINHLDFRAWLAQKGLTPLTLDSAVVRFLYTGTFANLYGGNGLIGAGTAMNFLSASVGYKGAFVWKFKAGTGDTLVAPIYNMLAHRGVKFKFFHKAVQVHHSETGEIEQITIAKQVDLIQEPYQPLTPIKGELTWANKPDYSQIVPEQAKKLQEENINLESAWSPWQNVSEFVLKKGEDFDAVILGIPVAALGGENGICKEIINANDSWQKMYQNVKTTATQSVQAWISKDYTALGMDLAQWGIQKGATPNLVTYASPLYSWIDMSIVLPQESWQEGKQPPMLLYYCGSMTDPDYIPPFSDTQYPQKEIDRLVYTTQQWLNDNMGYFFPNATSIEYPQGFDLSILFDMYDRPNATPNEKLLSQYLRVNVNPWDRYTLSIPNSGFYRLKTDQSGYKNLFLTGDWIDFGVNVGYIEGAVNSGFQAGQAVRKFLQLPINKVEMGELKI
ncbi:flavin monoamine oxidase family protein [Thermoflexibacter ruber]|uniref:NAD(P)-binding Rossmann-like domain-containing protein n=1 Tax=Thermoflexibacter ruber TaxID=1003 RepID=A0A1I2JG62_9BACT|nr:NAD(P)-binding protein [Thermoflexibacter ruber]SFF52147.1 NAD(P)-binding Rossmann-like domain-containing protein [Thermoflexibacter ruber]